MTISKMMVGRQVGTFYLIAFDVNKWKALFFTLPIVLMKSVFLTFFLASVSYEYEHEVLNKDFKGSFNWFNSILFCCTNDERRFQNKRAKALQENEKIEKQGENAANGAAGGDDSDG